MIFRGCLYLLADSYSEYESDKAEILLSMEQRFEMFEMKLSIINHKTTKSIPKNLLKPRPYEKGETSSQQA